MFDVLTMDEILNSPALITKDALKGFLFGGVYVMLKNDKILYIGKAEEMFCRLSVHIKESRKDFDKILIIPTSCKEDSALLEALYIDKHKNQGNIKKEKVHQWVNIVEKYIDNEKIEIANEFIKSEMKSKILELDEQINNMLKARNK